MPEQADNSRSRLLAAASRLFQEKGYAATGLSEILRTAGAPKGSLYHHFPKGKAELTAAAMRGAGKTLRDALRQARASTPDAASAIEHFADTLAGWLESSSFTRGCPIATVVLECAPGPGDIAQTLQTALSRTIDLVAEMIEADGATPQRARALGEFTLAALEGALILARAQADAGPVKRAGAQAAALIRFETAP
jgi:TetR/AcrR family transcriptional repressor of lmrAB and yxaGH operons